MKFCLGDKVRIIDTSGIYSKFLDYLSHYSFAIPDEALSKFTYSYTPEDNAKENEYVVEFIGQHLTHNNIILCVITSPKHTLIVDEDCLEFIPIEEEEEEEAELKEGDKVMVIDYGKCYSSYENFMLKHKKKINDTVFWNYRYNQGFSRFYEENKDYGFTVQLVANHIRPEDGKLAIISNDRDTFLFHVDGLLKI